jgi:hypothetical protein
MLDFGLHLQFAAVLGALHRVGDAAVTIAALVKSCARERDLAI